MGYSERGEGVNYFFRTGTGVKDYRWITVLCSIFDGLRMRLGPHRMDGCRRKCERNMRM